SVRGDSRGLRREDFLWVIAALAYLLSRVDIVPDFIFGVGLLVDLAVLAWVVRRWQSELDDLKVWRVAQGVVTKQALRV
ncbi:YkvA family protein, partial [Pseudomonas aeruginosa]|uniref:YkvA family protein n=1 Tax=Pseudomonas aeruginosa TaxID=287 RepID=UPI003CC6495D